MTTILLTGADGVLGHDLVRTLEGYDLRTPSSRQLDITDEAQVAAAVAGCDVVVNAAAYTAVDDAESHREEAFAVNAEGPRLLARAAKRHGARLIHVSTDYVFDGRATTAYPEDAPLSPVSVYGQSKAAGEGALAEEYPEGSIIIRTAWLYGAHGGNFPKTMLRLARERDEISVVTDQIGQPTWSADLAQWIATLISSPIRHGIFHGTNAGQTSWWGFARELFDQMGLDKESIVATTSAAYPRPAPRPAWSVLGHDAWAAAGLPQPRPWEEALAEAIPVCFPGDLR